MFFDDAITASRELEITLTGKECGQEERAPMCGVPHHAAEMYISKLIAKGYKVAICEQLEDPKTTKGIVKRGVIRVVTPGTIVESNMVTISVHVIDFTVSHCMIPLIRHRVQLLVLPTLKAFRFPLLLESV
jgi:DNA mismatch repair protein MutS